MACAVDMTTEKPGWRDHDRKGTDGCVRRWSCANRLQRVTIIPAIVEIKAALEFQLEQVDAVVGESSKSSGMQPQHMRWTPALLSVCRALSPSDPGDRSLCVLIASA